MSGTVDKISYPGSKQDIILESKDHPNLPIPISVCVSSPQNSLKLGRATYFLALNQQFIPLKTGKRNGLQYRATIFLPVRIPWDFFPQSVVELWALVTLLSRGWSFRDLQTTAHIRTARLGCGDELPGIGDVGEGDRIYQRGKLIGVGHVEGSEKKKGCLQSVIILQEGFKCMLEL